MIIEICSGNGRFDAPGEEIIAIDIDKKVRPTILADVRYLPLKQGIKPRLCHASPPCTYISAARGRRWGWNPKGIAETFEIWAACYKAFDWLEAKTCTIENPRGIERFLGTKIQFRYDKSDLRNCTTNFYSNNKSLKRALIPQNVRQKILDAI